MQRGTASRVVNQHRNPTKAHARTCAFALGLLPCATSSRLKRATPIRESARYPTSARVLQRAALFIHLRYRNRRPGSAILRLQVAQSRPGNAPFRGSAKPQERCLSAGCAAARRPSQNRLETHDLPCSQIAPVGIPAFRGVTGGGHVKRSELVVYSLSIQ